MVLSHQQGRVESVELNSQKRGRDYLTLTDKSRAQEGGHASRITSRPVRLVESRFLMPHALLLAVGFQ
jgi:hypothetical protein